jgi:hypothetical protein
VAVIVGPADQLMSDLPALGFGEPVRVDP